tara:strand:- start:218 stop:559 length:342 start_codon:yes stop_codon:yes gene_type:complete
MKTYKIPRHQVFRDFAIINTISGTYVCPGWHPVEPGTLREQIVLVDYIENNPVSKKVDTPVQKINVKQTKHFKVLSSNGKTHYNVDFDGKEWYCDCPASNFFRGHCKHIKAKK